MFYLSAGVLGPIWGSITTSLPHSHLSHGQSQPRGFFSLPWPLSDPCFTSHIAFSVLAFPHHSLCVLMFECVHAGLCGAQVGQELPFSHLWAGEMAQQRKELAAKPDDPSLIPGMHAMYRGN